MPRVWLIPQTDGQIIVSEVEYPDGLAVDMNASLLRQIRAANKKYHKFQMILFDFYEDAVEHPGTIRRVR